MGSAAPMTGSKCEGIRGKPLVSCLQPDRYAEVKSRALRLQRCVKALVKGPREGSAAQKLGVIRSLRNQIPESAVDLFAHRLRRAPSRPGVECDFAYPQGASHADAAQHRQELGKCGDALADLYCALALVLL